MAVEVLDYQGFPKRPPIEGDVDEAMVVHLHSMQNLVTLLAKQQDCPPMATSDTAISDFKKLITLLGGSDRRPQGGSGHARFRYAPATPLSRVSSHVSDRARSLSALDDAVQAERISGVDAQPISLCSLSNHMDVRMHNASAHHAAPGTTDTQRGHVFQPCSPCSTSGNEDKAHAHARRVSMNDASLMLCLASSDKLISHMSPHHQSCYPCKEGNRDKNQSNLHVSGHARCRDSTAQKVCHQQSAVSGLALSQAHKIKPCPLPHELNQGAFVPKTNSSLLSSVSMDGGAGTVSSGKPVISSGRPPLPPKKRKAPEKIEDCATKCHNSTNCHCAKRRKLKTIRVKRVSSMGLNDGEIPDDGYSWCIYGEKLSKESSQPRVYYKCSSVRGCPARKHVERASDDPNTLIVTYGREHLHPQIRQVLRASE